MPCERRSKHASRCCSRDDAGSMCTEATYKAKVFPCVDLFCFVLSRASKHTLSATTTSSGSRNLTPFASAFSIRVLASSTYSSSTWIRDLSQTYVAKKSNAGSNEKARYPS